MKRKALVLCTLLVLLAGIMGMSLALKAHAAGADTQVHHKAKKVTITSTFLYSPASLTIKVGTTVTWTNSSSAAHTVASDDRHTFRSHAILPGGTFSFTFLTKGTFPYHCTFHTYMKGTIIVQ